MVPPRTASLLGLGALPAIAYYTVATDLVIAVSLLNILIITTALYLAFSPISENHAAHA